MTRTRDRPSSVSSGSLMQEVPGAFPVRQSLEQTEPEQVTNLSLSEAVHARRAEYLRPQHVRIKIGTWNVAALKGTEKDVAGWFIEGKGISKTLSGLDSGECASSEQHNGSTRSSTDSVEDVLAQEARYAWKQPTIPIDDPGTLPGDDNIGIYVLALQEVVDITSTAEALRPYVDPGVANKWKDVVASALPKGYQVVAEQQLIGLLLLVFASPDVADEVKAVSTTSVGTGLMGYMGNKGAVTARIVIGDTTRIVFVNSHLAAGADRTSLERRNWDASQIIQRTKFDAIKDAMDLSQTTGERIGDEDFAFFTGDLNYRLETIPGEDVRRLLMLHTRNEYDLSKRRATHKIDKEIELAAEAAERRRRHASSLSSADSSITGSPRPSSETETASTNTSASTLMEDLAPNDDPTSLQTTLSSLLPHDELHQQMKTRKAFHDGWREGPISFLPTYKYDVGSVGVFDSSEKKRAPSWCDRILYRTRKDKLRYDAKVKEEEEARQRDEAMKASGTDQAGDDDEILYDYDPDADGLEASYEYDENEDYESVNSAQRVTTKEGSEDEIRLEYYTAHQRVLSSDHKPLVAVFSLKYEAVVPELKANVHAEVAKDLDKAENEGRPNVTVVVDQQSDKQAQMCDESSKGFEGVWFGDVRWNQSKIRTVTIANTSRVPATFQFIERPADEGQVSGIAPTWLTLKMYDTVRSSTSKSTSPITLEPGDSVSVELTIQISDTSFVRELNDGVLRLDDVLVLRVEGGRDHFVPVKAKWLNTTLSQTFDKLIRIPEGGIRKLQNQTPDKSKSKGETDLGSEDPPAAQPVRFSAPRELFRLTEAIEELATRCIAEWTMISSEFDSPPWLQHHGWPFDKENWMGRTQNWWESALSEVCNALDVDESLETCLPPGMPRMQRLYVLADYLLLFLTSIPGGLVDEQLWGKLDDFLIRIEKSKQKPSKDEQRTAVQEILSESPSHSISFILLTTMLDRLLHEVVAANRGRQDEPSSPTLRKFGALRRMTSSFGKDTEDSNVGRTRAAFARIFAGVIFGDSSAQAKKHNANQGKRRIELIEIFLNRDDPE